MSRADHLHVLFGPLIGLWVSEGYVLYAHRGRIVLENFNLFSNRAHAAVVMLTGLA